MARSRPSTAFRPGACFVLEHDGRCYAFWIASQHRGRDAGDIGVVCLDLVTSSVPPFEACARARAFGLRPEGRGTWSGEQALVAYRAEHREEFFAALAECCVVVGRTRVFKTPRMLWSSSGFGGPLCDATALRAKLLKLRELNAEKTCRHRLDRVLDLLVEC